MGQHYLKGITMQVRVVLYGIEVFNELSAGQYNKMI